jgi:alkanesulfonate monooxygenase SsuD/methylene tetrahydromethanopterin reductase-like flavin-dependent oxidoreductase (luciferase family)
MGQLKIEGIGSMKLGYLVPTREAVMEGRPQTRPLIELAVRAEGLGFDSIWVGDSLLARPRHEPLTLLAGIATVTRSATLGTAVLLPAYRNPVVMAQQIATLDQLCDGRLILGVGIAADRPNVRAEFTAAGVPFDKRVARLQEGLRLCRALWSGESVDWDGLWQLEGAVLGPVPVQTGGPPIWGGGTHPNALARTGKTMDGWLPLWPDRGEDWARAWETVRGHADEAGRSRTALTGAAYLTVYIDDDRSAADARIERFLEVYYDVPGALMRTMQACRGGPADEVGAWIDEFIKAGAEHIVLRFAGEHERQLDLMAELRGKFEW